MTHVKYLGYGITHEYDHATKTTNSEPTCGIVKRMSEGKTNGAELKYYARVFLTLLCAAQGKQQATKKKRNTERPNDLRNKNKNTHIGGTRERPATEFLKLT